MSNEQLNSGTYEIIQNRLNEQKLDLIQRIQALNEDRKKVFGGIDFSLIANERISTDQNCQIKDIFSLENLCLVGHNTHLGLRSEINLNDVFSAYLLIDNRFEPQSIQFIEDATFIEEFKNLYKYYRNTFFVRFHVTQNYLYFVFQLSNSPSDIKAFKWLIKDNSLTFVDARSAAEVKYPTQQEFTWTKVTREMQRKGSHPHVSLADKVFVEAIGGDLTIKIEDNTNSGKGIYSEDVLHKDQTLDDAEIHYFDYNNLVIFKIKPYQETERYFIYNHKEKKVARVDSLQYSIILLPENQGVIYPNGYALQTGEIRVIATEDKPVYFKRRIIGNNGENFMFVFYDEQSYDYILIPYNIIKQTIETPINCNGFTLFDNGKLAYFKSNEETKHHLIQIWQTPFTKEITVDDSLKNNLLYKIGNKDLVRVMAESQELNILLSKKDSYSGLYDDIVKQATIILDSYYFLGEKEVHQLNEPLLEIRKIAHAAINEFEKAQEIKNKTAQTVAELKDKCEQILSETSVISYQSLDQFIAVLAQIRGLRGEIIGAKELKYVEITILQSLEEQLHERAESLSNACVSFLLQDNALLPYQEKVEAINQQIAALQKAIDAKSLEQNIDELALQLELLVDIVNNLKIEDTSQSTQIIENISLIFAQINQQRIELNNKKREISGKELSSDFKAQITLFDQKQVRSV
ncbi:MAG: DNA repair ATPase [Flavobacterium sp.]|nr:DNA repair ATPase [Flavobacterium sp.]